MTPDYDVIVVGAGPAGATAGRHASLAGLRTLILERRNLPRPKPCGGGVSRKALDLLSFGVPEELVAGRIRSMEFVTPSGSRIVTPDGDYGITTWRPQFDAFLVRQAVLAGSEFAEGEAVRSLQPTTDGVMVITESRTFYTAKVVVGADGAMGPCGRLLNGRQKLSRLGFAYEAFLHKRTVSDTASVVRSELHLLDVPFGYAWLFEKRDGFSIGCGGIATRASYIHARFRDFHAQVRARRGGLLVDEPLHAVGAFLPPAGFRRRLADRRVMLVGDAAALVDSLTGEGIYYALRSAQSAVESVVPLARGETGWRETARRYSTACQREMISDLRAALCISYLRHFFGRLGHELLIGDPRRRARGTTAIELAQGHARYREVLRRKLRAWLRIPG